MRSPFAPAIALAALSAVACGHPAPTPPASPSSTSRAAPSTAATAPRLMTSADVDLRLEAEWRRAGITPTPPADDATWLRRAWIDVLGTIPPPDTVRRFLADAAPDKRAGAVDEMLASPLWADHWTAYWDDVWMGRDARGQEVDREAFRAWLHDAFANDVPWDRIAAELLTATGRNTERGAVNFALKYQQTPQDMAGAVSRTLLGVRIQCAQCHDDKTEKWTQQDFRRFAAAFARTRVAPAEPDPPAVGVSMPPARGRAPTVRRLEVLDLDRPAPRFAKMGDLAPIVEARPTALDGTDLGDGGGVRAALARWVTAPQNPWFARAFVNRMWAHFLGRGFVDPVDDVRPSNPVAAPDLLAALAADFVTSGFDVKHLVRVIVGSAAYARSAAPLDERTAKADPGVASWERFRVTPLGPDELLNALLAATDLDGIVRATGRLDLERVREKVKQRYGFLFDTDEESDQSDYEGTMAQALALLDGSVVATGASVLPGSALASILAAPGDDAARIEAVYLRTLSRPPTPGEVAMWTSFLAAPPPAPTPAGATPPGGVRASDAGAIPAARRPPPHPPQQPDPLRGLDDRAGRQRTNARVQAWEDMLWALLNSSEFALNH